MKDSLKYQAFQPHTANSLPVESAEVDSLVVDSLASAELTQQADVAVDPFELPHNPAYCVRPWLQFELGATTEVQQANASQVFGAQSILVTPPQTFVSTPQSLTDNGVFQGFVLLLAATYAFLLYRNLGDIRTLLDRVTRDTRSGERMTEESSNSGFSRFLSLTSTIGMLFLGVMAVKYSDAMIAAPLTRILSHAAVLALSLLATIAWVVVALYQVVVVRLAGSIIVAQPMMTQLLQLKRTYFALLVIVTSPFLLLFALCPFGTGGIWFIAAAIGLVITLFLYLKETLNLFLAKKISILHWFLYLCGVEVLPISTMWLLITR